MALNLAKTKIDTTSSSKGWWVMLSEGGEALVARWENPEFRTRQMQLQQEYRRAAHGRPHIKGRTVPPELVEDMNIRLVLETVLLGWKEIEESPGVAFPYSMENAKALLTVKHEQYEQLLASNEEYRWILEEVQTAAMDEQAFRLEQQEDDTENLSPALNGSSSTVSTPSG